MERYYTALKIGKKWIYQPNQHDKYLIGIQELTNLPNQNIPKLVMARFANLPVATLTASNR